MYKMSVGRFLAAVSVVAQPSQCCVNMLYISSYIHVPQRKCAFRFAFMLQLNNFLGVLLEYYTAQLTTLLRAKDTINN